MEKERLDLLLVYANDLYRYIAKKLGEDYEPKNLIGLLGWLDEHNVIIHIQPEFYSQGINWNWQISFYNPETFDDPDLMDGTGLYGDNFVLSLLKNLGTRFRLPNSLTSPLSL